MARWEAAQLYPEKDLSPIVVYDHTKFSGRVGALHELSPEEYGGQDPFDVKFAGRYTAVRLTSTKDSELQFVAVSYHGQQNLPKRFKGTAGDEQTYKADEEKRKNGRRLVKKVGEATVKLHMPAVVGGDWNCTFIDRQLPKSLEWEMRLKTVGGYLPHEDHCKRYNQPCIDFFCTLWPLKTDEAAPVVVVTSVRARAHIEHAERYDHDPVFCEFLVAKPGHAIGPLKPTPQDESQVPELKLKLLTRMQLEQAAVAMGRASTSPSKVLKFERLTLVRQLLKQPGVQYSHLCTSARQFLDIRGIGNDCSLASREGEGSDSDVEEDEPTLTAEMFKLPELQDIQAMLLQQKHRSLQQLSVAMGLQANCTSQLMRERLGKEAKRLSVLLELLQVSPAPLPSEPSGSTGIVTLSTDLSAEVVTSHPSVGEPTTPAPSARLRMQSVSPEPL